MNSIAADPAADPRARAGPSKSAGRSAGSMLLLAGLILLLWAISLAFLMQTVVTTDVGWFLFSTRKWLAGATLYVDIVEVNPPLAFFLTAPATLIEMSGWLDEQSAFFVYVAILIAVSLIWCFRFILQASLDARQTFVLMLAIFAALFLVPFADFGQREQLALIFSMPYVILSAYRVPIQRSAIERFAVGSFAVLGLALKPYFLAVPAMIIIARIIAGRSWAPAMRVLFSPENLAIALGCLTYLMLIWVWYPEFLQTIFPLARLVYIGIGHEYRTLMKLAAMGLLVIFPIVLATCNPAAGERHRPIVVFLAATTGFLISYLVQGKAWHYQIVPVVSWAIVTASLHADSLIRENRQMLTATVLAVVISGAIIDPLVRSGGVQPEVQRLLETHRHRLEGRKVAGWSSHLQTGFPTINILGAEWATRYPHLWPVYGALQLIASNDDPQARRNALDAMSQARRNIVDDLIRMQPDIILIETLLGGNFLDYLAGDSRFAAAFAPYSRIDTIDETEIWERNSGTP